MLSYQLEKIQTALQIPETEESWDRIAATIQDLTKLLQQDGCEDYEQFIPICKAIHKPIVAAANSERTRLSGPAIDLVAAMAAAFGQSFASLLPLYFPTILSLSGRTSKVTLNRAKSCIMGIIDGTQLSAILSYFLPTIKDKAVSLRLMSAEGVLACLNTLNPPDLEKGDRPGGIENVIRATSRDANADVRKVGKKIFQAYTLVFPDRVDKFTDPLSPTIKKYLDVKPKLASSQSAVAANSKAVAARLAGGFSSSTSSAESKPLPPRTGHTRSASSSTLTLTKQGSSSQLDLKRSARTANSTAPKKNDMLPPQYVPVRTRTTSSQSQPTSRPPSRPNSRPPSQMDSHGQGAEPGVESKAPANGPVRLFRQDSAPQRVAPSRPPVKPAQSSTGPRKVVLPITQPPQRPTSAPTVADSATAGKHESAPPHRMEPQKARGGFKPTSSTEGSKRAAVSSQPPAHSSSSSSSKPGAKPSDNQIKPPAVSRSKEKEGDGAHAAVPAHTIARVAAAGQTRALNVTKAAPTAIRRPVPAKSTVAQPTQAQLARAKSITQPKPVQQKPSAAASRAAVVSKPGWGRPAAKKPAPAQSGKAKAAVHPAQVPLPPSPKRGKARRVDAASMPFPPSPKARKVVPRGNPASVPLPPSPKPKPTGLEHAQEPEVSDTEGVDENDEDEVFGDVRPVAVSDTESAHEVADELDEDDVFGDVRPPVASEIEQDVPTAVQHSNDEEEKPEDQAIQPELMVTEPSAVVEQPEPEKRQQGAPPQTPISTLLYSIERGFMYTPGSPLSPPIKYSSHANRPALPPCPFLKPQSSDSDSDTKTPVLGKEERQALGIVEINQY